MDCTLPYRLQTTFSVFRCLLSFVCVHFEFCFIRTDLKWCRIATYGNGSKYLRGIQRVNRFQASMQLQKYRRLGPKITRAVHVSAPQTKGLWTRLHAVCLIANSR